MSQLYNGNRYEPAPVEGAPLARNVAAEDIAIGMGRVAQNVDAVSHGLLRHADESRKLEDALELRRVRAEAKTLMEERLNLRDGDPDALFREDGTPNKQSISELMKPFAARLDKVGRRLLNPDERAQMRFNADAAWVDLENGAYQMAEAASRARRDRKLGDGYKLAMETGDFEGAAMFARAGAETGSWTPEQAELMAVNAQQEASKETVKKLELANDIDGLWDLYDSGSFDGDVAAEEYLLDAIKRCTKPEDSMRKSKSGAPEVRRHCSRGTPSDLLSVWNEFNGDFKSHEAKNAARAGLDAYARGTLSYSPTPAEEAQVKQKFKEFGGDADFANATIARIKQERTSAGTFNSEKAANAIPGWQFFRPVNRGKIAGFQRDLEDAKRRERETEKKTDKEAAKKARAEAEANLKRWERYAKEEGEKARNAIIADYSRMLLEHGGKPDYTDCVQMFRKAVGNYMSSHGVADDTAEWESMKLLEEQRGAFAQSVLAKQEKAERENDAVRSDILETDGKRELNGEFAQPKESQAAAAGVQGKPPAEPHVDLVNTDRQAAKGLPGNASESVVYVPEGHQWAGRTIMVRAGQASSYAKVQETDVTEVTLSRRLRQNLMLTDIWTNQARFEGDELFLGCDVDDGLVPLGLFPEDGYGVPEEAVPMSDIGL